MDFEIPPDVIAKGPEAVADFERGAWWMVRIIAHDRIEKEYGPAGLSTLPEGDERGQPPPGPEALTWMREAVGWYPLDFFHEGGFGV